MIKHATHFSGIKRISENLGRAAGLPEDKLPEVVISEESTPPTINDTELANRLKNSWQEKWELTGLPHTHQMGWVLKTSFFHSGATYTKRLFCYRWNKP